MRGIDMFCASQAATDIRLNMEEGSSSSPSSSTIHLGGGGGGGRAIDRHNPIIRDARRLGKALPLPPCTSQTPPIAPIPYNHLHRKGRNSSSSKSDDQKTNKKKSSSSSSSKSSSSHKKSTSGSKPSHHQVDMKRKSCATKGADLISPPGSSRYLLGGGGGGGAAAAANFLEVLSDNFNPVLTLVPMDSTKSPQPFKPEESSAASISKPPSSSSPSPDQVVVLRVSLHCKGCEGKVRKHISRMQGVKSFNIDFAAKKVTVVGDVTPLGVLASISKVKNAQLWTPPPAAANAMPSSVLAAASSTNTCLEMATISKLKNNAQLWTPPPAAANTMPSSVPTAS